MENPLISLFSQTSAKLTRTDDYLEKLQYYQELGEWLETCVFRENDLFLLRNLNIGLEIMIASSLESKTKYQESLKLVRLALEEVDVTPYIPEKIRSLIKQDYKRKLQRRRAELAKNEEKRELEIYNFFDDSPFTEEEKMFFATHFDEFIFRAYDTLAKNYLC